MTAHPAGPTFRFHIDEGKVAEFAAACTDENPMHRGPDAVAPPTFLQVAGGFWEDRDARPQPVPAFDLSRVLHGEQEFEYVRPLRANETLFGTTSLESITEKVGRRGGSMRVAVLATTFTDERGETVAVSKSTIIERAPQGVSS